MNIYFNPQPKPTHTKIKKPNKIQHNRNKPRLRDRGRVRLEVYQQAYEAAGGRCEWCKWVDGSFDPSGQKWRLEAAHIVRRRHLEETTADDIAFLCGPSTNTGTCHNIADYTRAGRERLLAHQKMRREKDAG